MGLTAAAIAVFVVGPAVVEQFHSRFLVQTFQQQYDGHRGEIAHSAWELFEAHPFAGAGLDGYYALVGVGTSLEYPHNLALATAGEGGSVGQSVGPTLLVLTLVAFTWVVMGRWPLAVETLHAAAGAVYMLTASMFSGGYYDSRFLGFFLALAAIEARRADHEIAVHDGDRSERRRSPAGPRIADGASGKSRESALTR